MSLTVIKVDSPSAEQIAKFGNKPSSKIRSNFTVGATFTLKNEIGWRRLTNDHGEPIVDGQGDEIVFPVIETTLGDEGCISLGLFEPQWDDKLDRLVLAGGALGEFFRQNSPKMTRIEMLQAMIEKFGKDTFTVSIRFYNKAKNDGGFFKANLPTFIIEG